MVELRYVLLPHTTTRPAKLQWRVHLPVVDAGGTLCPGDWTEWEDVPTVVLAQEGERWTIE